MKIIVTGGRFFNDYSKVEKALKELNPTFIIQGGASGADRLAIRFALENKIKYQTYQADWKTHKKAAGPIRNRLMLSNNQDALVVAFEGGKGTKNCVDTAISLGMKVVEIK
jgi:hypothetical protein